MKSQKGVPAVFLVDKELSFVRWAQPKRLKQKQSCKEKGSFGGRIVRQRTFVVETGSKANSGPGDPELSV